MKAVILCAGKGTRIRPLTYYINKSMLPLSDGRPVLAHILEHLRKYCITPVIATSKDAHAEQVEQFAGRHWLDMSITEKASGTAGEVFKAKKFLKDEEDFLVYYGDILTDIPLDKFYEYHKKQKAIATLCGMEGSARCDKGVLEGDGYVTMLKEKPILPLTTNCPIFWVNKRIWKYLKPKDNLDFMLDVLPEILKKEKIALLHHEGLYVDIGNLNTYEQALEATK